MPLITFSTLACPRRSISEVIARAKAFGFDGIEWRGGAAGHVNPSMSRSKLAELVRGMQDTGLTSLALTTYTAFVSPQRQEREANIQVLREYIDLAKEIGARYVRAFIGELDRDQKAPYPQIIECFEAAILYAQAAGVGIAIEHHDDFVKTRSIEPILAALPDPFLGVVWDIANGFSAGETPADAFPHSRDRIFYVQVKDGKGQHEEWQLTNVGEGQVPLREAFELLRKIGYDGAFSVEWEYAWHPELDPPEIALPRARQYIAESLARICGQEHAEPSRIQEKGNR